MLQPECVVRRSADRWGYWPVIPDLGDEDRLISRELRSLFRAEDAAECERCLLARHGDVATVLASIESTDCRNSNVAKDIVQVLQSLRRFIIGFFRAPLLENAVANRRNDLVQYLRWSIGSSQVTEVHVLFLTWAGNLCLDQLVWRGNGRFAHIDWNEVLQRGVDVQAGAIIVAQNRPDGNLEPSEDDLRMTLVLQMEASEHAMSLLDHYLLWKSSWRSCKSCLDF